MVIVQQDVKGCERMLHSLWNVVQCYVCNNSWLADQCVLCMARLQVYDCAYAARTLLLVAGKSLPHLCTNIVSILLLWPTFVVLPC